jgi:hypothetical protein
VCIADLLAQACVAELGLGFLYCLHANNTALHNILRLSVLVVSFILFALAVSSLGLVNAEYTKYFNYLNSQVWNWDSNTYTSTLSSSTPFDEDAFYQGVKAANDLSIAFDVIIFVASVLLVGFSVYVLYACRRNPALKSVSKRQSFRLDLPMPLCLVSLPAADTKTLIVGCPLGRYHRA